MPYQEDLNRKMADRKMVEKKMREKNIGRTLVSTV
jgi:hypothetical protein